MQEIMLTLAGFGLDMYAIKTICLTQTATSGAGGAGARSGGAWSFAIRSLKFVKSRLKSPTLDKFILACCLCSADGAGKGGKFTTRRLSHCSTPKPLTIALLVF